MYPKYHFTVINIKTYFTFFVKSLKFGVYFTLKHISSKLATFQVHNCHLCGDLIGLHISRKFKEANDCF